MLRFLQNKNLIYLLLFAILLLIFSYLVYKTYPIYIIFFQFIWRISLPFLIAGFLAYLLYPLISFLNKHQIHKGLAVLLIYTVFFGGIGFLFYRVYPLIIQQLNDLTQNFPEFIKMYDDFIYSIYDYTAFLPETVHEKVDGLFTNIEAILDQLLTKLMNGFMHIFDMIIIITVIPVLVFYFIKDQQLLKGFFMKIIPTKNRQYFKKVAEGIDKNLGGYIRGQLIVCSFVALTTFLIFKWLDVPYALLLAILFGITNLIPYFGPIIGAIPAVILAYTVSASLALYVIIAVVVIQIIEGNLLSPYIVGKSINIHPVAIIFVLLLGGELFGVIGMLLAVPVLTILKVFYIHLSPWTTTN
ncbi:AI-2E family transporter [Oceanobacillus sp. CAU 1775]